MSAAVGKSGAAKEYRDAVRRYLREGYGVDPEYVTGNGHPAFAFKINGRPYRVLLNENNVHRRGTLGVDQKLQDIRRLLGAPPNSLTTTNHRRKEKRTLDQMTEALRKAGIDKVRTDYVNSGTAASTAESIVRAVGPEPAAPATAAPAGAFVAPDLKGRLSFYKNRLRLVLDERAYVAFCHDGRVQIRRPRVGEAWCFEIRAVPGAAVTRGTQKLRYENGAGGYVVDATHDVIDFFPSEFSSSPVKLTVTRGLLVVAVDPTKLKATKTHRVPLDAQPASPPAPAPETAPLLPVVPPDATSPEQRMRYALRLIQSVEAETSYRLRRVAATEGKAAAWVWRAPEIGL